MALLVFDGFLCAVLSVLFLPLWLGATPFPISILFAAVVNVLLVIAARSVTGRVSSGLLPLGGWLVGFVLCMFGGPGGDILLLPSVWTVLLLVGGLVPAAVYLWTVCLRTALGSVSAGTAGGMR